MRGRRRLAAVEASGSYDMAATARSKKARKKPPPKRAKRSLLASRRFELPRPVLEPQHVDIIALALIAIGVFLGGVAYLHWSGGALGDGAVKGTRFVFGALGYAVPAALVAAGGLILAREVRPPARPMRTGTLCLTAAITLAFAAGTLGLGPGALHGSEFWRASAFESRGGIVGQGELWVSSHLISTLGASILAAFLFAAGLILVTGATLAGVIRATGAGMAGTSRALRRSTEEIAASVRRPSTEAARGMSAMSARPEPHDDGEPVLPPELDTAELVVRATHVEAPPIEAIDEPDADEETVAVREAETAEPGGQPSD